MAFDPDLHDRRSTRLRGYDYSRPGAYFVTICTAGRRCILGQIVAGTVVPTVVGTIVQREWANTVFRGAEFSADQVVVMPNHIHAIVHIRRRSPAHAEGGQMAAPTAAGERTAPLGTLINIFKAASTQRVRAALRDPRFTLWQRGFFDRVIRSEKSLHKIRRYIRDNPANWARDRDNPEGM